MPTQHVKSNIHGCWEKKNKKRLHFRFRCFQGLKSAWILDKMPQIALNHKCSTLRLNGFILAQLGYRMARLLTDRQHT